MMQLYIAFGKGLQAVGTVDAATLPRKLSQHFMTCNVIYNVSDCRYV